VRHVRAALRAFLAGCPVADDAVHLLSELCANAIAHSDSKDEFFTVRCEVHPGYVRIECEDLGGEWHCRQQDERPHGLDIVEALTGPDGWGVDRIDDGDRVVWARLAW